MRRVALGLLLLAGCGPGEVVGVVADDAGPVAGARVRHRGRPDAVVTGPDGRFRLPAFPGRPITAAKEGYHIATADPAGNVALRRLPAGDCERYEWVAPTPGPPGSRHCGTCHADAHAEWADTGHARAATNPRLLDLLRGTDARGRPGIGWSLAADNPDGAGVCLSCHAPTAPAGVFDLAEVAGVAQFGVHCDFCHKVAGLADGAELGLTHGRFALRLVRPDLAAGERQVILGPHDDANRDENSFSPFQRDSRLCAACHEGIVFGVPVYSTYSEWRDSPAGRAGKPCQACHMTPTGRTRMAVDGPERDPETLAGHRAFAGDRADMLRRGLRLRLSAQREAGGVVATVEVTATNVGHRVPTGFIDRNLTLSVEAVAADGRLTRQASVRVYAKRVKDVDEPGPVPFWRPGATTEDTRLRPGEPHISRHEFPEATVRVRAALVHRRFWPATTAEKGWPDDATLAGEAEVMVAPAMPAR